MTLDEVLDLLDERVGPVGQTKWAKANRVSQAYVSEVVRGSRKPGPAILSALGLKRVELYVPAKRGEG